MRADHAHPVAYWDMACSASPKRQPLPVAAPLLLANGGFQLSQTSRMPCSILLGSCHVKSRSRRARGQWGAPYGVTTCAWTARHWMMFWNAVYLYELVCVYESFWRCHSAGWSRQ